MSSSRNTSSRGLLTKSDSTSSLDELLNRLGDNDPDRKDTVAHDVTWDSNIHDSVMAELSSQVTELDPLLENEELDDESCDVTGDQSDETRTMTRRASMRLRAHTASSKRACKVTNSKPKSTSAGRPADVTSIPETQLSPTTTGGIDPTKPKVATMPSKRGRRKKELNQQANVRPTWHFALSGR